MKWLIYKKGLHAWLKQVWVGQEAGDVFLANEGLVCHTKEGIGAPLNGSRLTLGLEEGHLNLGWRMGETGQGAWRGIS